MHSKIKLVAQIILTTGFLILLATVLYHFRQPIGNHTPAAPSIQMPAVTEFRTMNYQQQLDLIKAQGQVDPIATWAYLKTALFVNGQQISNAHDLAHLVGNAMFAKYGLDGITNCDETFAFGCYHGVTQKLLEQQGTSVVREIQDRCIQIFPPDQSQNYTGCIHGMGHGLLTWEHFLVGKALSDCDALDTPYQSYCYDGVFMEHASDLTKNEFDPAHPWQFCAALDSKYHYNCARYQSQIFLSQLGSSIPTIGTNCMLGPNETLRTTCLESLGYYITQTSLGNLSLILNKCNQLKGDASIHCIIGASREVAFQSYADWQNTDKSLCASLPDSWRSQCGPSPGFVRPN